MKRASPPDVAADRGGALQRQAYRAAGHLLMDYLLRRGTAGKYLPMDRSQMLPERRSITVNGAGTHWDEITSALGSWMTVPQVLLAGYVSERLKFHNGDITLQSDAPLVEKSRQLLAAYLDHYGEGANRSVRDANVEANLVDMHAYAARFVRWHWAAIESLAAALVRQRTLDRHTADDLVRRALLRRSVFGWVRLGLEDIGRRRRRRPAGETPRK